MAGSGTLTTGSRTDWFTAGAVALISMVGAAAVVHASRNGIGISPDSAVYLSAAHRFAVGEGLSSVGTGAPAPLTWFPPFYPLVLGLAERAGWQARSAAAGLNAACWSSTIVLAGLLARRGCGGSRLAMVMGALAALCVPAMSGVFSLALSEPLFIVLVVGIMCCLAALTGPDHRPWRLWGAAGLLTGLAVLTRYAGVGLIPAGVLAVVMLSGAKVWRRLGQAVGYVALSVLPLGVWNFSLAMRGVAKAPRAIAWHPITGDGVRQGLTTLAGFFVPIPLGAGIVGGFVFAGVAALAIGIVVVFGRRHEVEGARVSPAASVVCVSMVFSTVYVAFLVLSISVADAQTPLDWRILSPIVVPIWVAVLTVVWTMVGSLRPVWAVAVALVAATLVGQAVVARPHLFDEALDGVFTERDSAKSLLLTAVRELPSGSAVFSNQRSAVYLFTHRLNDSLPEVDDMNVTPATFDEVQMDALDAALERGPVFAVYWLDERVEFGEPVMTEEQLSARATVEQRRVFADGVLLQLGAKAN